MTPPAAAAAPRTRTRRTTPPARRVSGPARTTSSRARTAAAAAVAGPAPLALRLGGAVHGIAEHRLLERIIRGRAWIGILAVGLIGIVFMQVSMLRLNAGIGQAVEKSSVLERQNSAMRAAISELSSGDRIASEAERLGLIVPAGTPRFLDARGADPRRALSSMTIPGEGIVPSTTSETTTPAAGTPVLGQSGVAPVSAPATATTDGTTVPADAGQPVGSQPSTAPSQPSTTQPAPATQTAPAPQPAATAPSQDPAVSNRTAAAPPPTGTTGGMDAPGQVG